MLLINMRRLQMALLIVVACLCTPTLGFSCNQVERKALLQFKQSIIVDTFNCLSSWVGEDCCSWNGIWCHNVTGNVIKLDLSPPDPSSPYDFCIFDAGEVNPALLELKYLTYLDLGSVYFYGSRFPEFIGSMRQLQHLHLSFANLSGNGANVLGNLTQLVFLDLRLYFWRSCGFGNLEWASNLKSLQYLYMSGVDLSQALDSLNILFKLPSLLNLTLIGCELGNSHLYIRNSSVSSSHIQFLDLGGNLFSGPIPHFIQNLSAIRFLGLSSNYFISPIPSWLGDKVDLEYLDLSHNDFNGSFPPFNALARLSSLGLSGNHFTILSPEIRNFSSLNSLDLSYNNLETLPPSIWEIHSLSFLGLSGNHFTVVSPGIGNLSSLQSLDLSVNNLETLPSSVWGLSSLKSLRLSDNNLSVVSPPNANCSLSSLRELDLSNNNLEVLPLSILGLPSLSELFLPNNHLKRVVSTFSENVPPLKTLDISNNRLDLSNNHLDLSHNNLSVVSPPNANCSLSSLRELDLSNNHLETLNLSLCQFPSLYHLQLSYNHFSAMPPFIGNSSFLISIDLSHNNLLTLPPSLGTLSSLWYLDLSYNTLSVVHQVSLANLSSLTHLDLSSNSATLSLDPDWMPPFQLWSLSVLPCKLNSPFPKWILSQKKLDQLDLSDTGIFGRLPQNIGDAMPFLQSLRLANNHINGSIPRSLCGIVGLEELDLQKNMLSGIIPNCWANSPFLGLELSSNRLSGHIPNSLTKVATLQLLSLGNNSLEGELPLSFSSSTQLTILDLGRNKLHGKIPLWNGASIPLLQILILRENSFNGSIPLQLCSFHSLQIIDLASNNLAGTIPRCFGYFHGMGSVQHSTAFIASPPSPIPSNITSDVASEPAVSPDEWSAVEVIKGDEREYTTNLHLLKNMDLSCNQLVGVIPAEITSLSQLLGLNFSHNHLNGAIPKEMGKMRSLESLDLSFNNLSGSIPESISALDSLSNLNFSFNNLQGQIPTGRHLQTLNDSSIYMGNPGLCGDPSPKKCFGDVTGHPPTSVVLEDEGDNRKEKMWFYMVIMSGFATGFWGVIGILVVHKRWRFAYFQIAEELADWIYVRVAVRIAKANRGR